MRTLVTGATGFIGTHLVLRLLRDGHRVRALARQSGDWSLLENEGVEVLVGSVSDKGFLSEASRDIDVVYNLIGQIGGWGVSRQAMRLANVTAVKNLLEACQGSSVSHFIHCSTPGVTGMRGVAPESLPCHPVSYYEVTKYEGEKQVLCWQAEGRAAVTIVRPDFVYGPGDLHKLKMFRAIRDGKFVLIGRGQSLLHPSYIDDIIDGLILVGGNQSALGEVFNLAGMEPVPVSRLAGAIARLLHTPIPRVMVPVLAAKSAAILAEATARLTMTEPLLTRYQVSFFSRDHASDISKAKLVLGYDPKVSLEDGLARTVKWYEQQRLL